MAPSTLHRLALPLILSLATLIQAQKATFKWGSDNVHDKNLNCKKSIYDVDPSERFKASDYESMTALCGWSEDGRPSFGCECQGGKGEAPQCYREKADINLYDYAVWPPGNVSIPVDFARACITDCICNPGLDASVSSKTDEINARISQQLAPGQSVQTSFVKGNATTAKIPTPFQFNSSETNPITCVGPMLDIANINMALQTSDYADLQSVCAANGGAFPTMGYDCSGPDGSVKYDKKSADPNLSQYHRPEGNEVQPIILEQICNSFCFCPDANMSSHAQAWQGIWYDGSRLAAPPDDENATALEYFPNGMEYGAGLKYQKPLGLMRVGLDAGPNITNIEQMYLDSIQNFTISSNTTSNSTMSTCAYGSTNASSYMTFSQCVADLSMDDCNQECATLYGPSQCQCDSGNSTMSSPGGNGTLPTPGENGTFASYNDCLQVYSAGDCCPECLADNPADQCSCGGFSSTTNSTTNDPRTIYSECLVSSFDPRDCTTEYRECVAAVGPQTCMSDCVYQYSTAQCSSNATISATNSTGSDPLIDYGRCLISSSKASDCSPQHAQCVASVNTGGTVAGWEGGDAGSGSQSEECCFLCLNVYTVAECHCGNGTDIIDNTNSTAGIPPGAMECVSVNTTQGDVIQECIPSDGNGTSLTNTTSDPLQDYHDCLYLSQSPDDCYEQYKQCAQAYSEGECTSLDDDSFSDISETCYYVNSTDGTLTEICNPDPSVNGTGMNDGSNGNGFLNVSDSTGADFADDASWDCILSNGNNTSVEDIERCFNATGSLTSERPSTVTNGVSEIPADGAADTTDSTPVTTGAPSAGGNPPAGKTQVHREGILRATLATRS